MPTPVHHLLLLLLPSLVTMVSSWTLQSFVSPKVSGHASCKLPNDKGLLLFGGLLPDRTATKELWRYANGEWKSVQSKNEGPGPRMYATASALDNMVYVIGGWDPEEKGSGGSFKDEIWSINPETLEWTLCGHLPCGPISRHTAVTVGSCIVVHSYKAGDECILVVNSDGTCHAQPTTGRNKPEGLSMCSAVALNDHEMILFGGSTKTQKMSNAVYVLDTATWEWRQLASRGTNIPNAMASTCMASVDEKSVLVFGGAGLSPAGYQGGAGLVATHQCWRLTVIDDDTADWTLLESNSSDDKHPRARLAASIQRIPGQKEFLLTGGWDPATADTFDDSWTLAL